MPTYEDAIEEAAAFISGRIQAPPRVALLAGTGLGASVEAISVSAAFEYADLPHFPVSTVQSHQGRLVVGSLAGHCVMALQGRFHLYEGYTARQVTFPIRVMQALGVKALVMANATGGLNPDFAAGDIMCIVDHINLSGENPLVGAHVEGWGPRFPEMTAAYDPQLIGCAEAVSRDLGIPMRKGVYVGLKGPSLETPAETQFLRTIGADAVGFSTVNETIVAVQAGIRVLGFAVITNMNVPGKLSPASVDAIIEAAQTAAPKVGKIVMGVLAAHPDL